MIRRDIIYVAKIVSTLFTPLYFPTIAIISTLMLTFLNKLPVLYKLKVVIIAYLFTILLPKIIINEYRKHKNLTNFQLGGHKIKHVPYIISMLCYFGAYLIMIEMRIPWVLTIIVSSAFFVQTMCLFINRLYNISQHTAAIGGATGVLIMYGEMFFFNPIWYLCCLILIGGAVGTSRMILRMQTFSQVWSGFLVGLLCTITVIIIN